MLYFSKILHNSLSMLSKFEGHRIKGLGDMIFQNCHENAKEAGTGSRQPRSCAIRQGTATQLRRQPRSLRGEGRQAGSSHAAASAATQPTWGWQMGTAHLRGPCVSPAPALFLPCTVPCCQEEKCKPTRDKYDLKTNK